MTTKNEDDTAKANKSYYDYMGDELRSFHDRRNNENFRKADKRERERMAKLWIDKAYKQLIAHFPIAQLSEILSKSTFFKESGFTAEEAQERIISHLKDSGKLRTGEARCQPPRWSDGTTRITSSPDRE